MSLQDTAFSKNVTAVGPGTFVSLTCYAEDKSLMFQPGNSERRRGVKTRYKRVNKNYAPQKFSHSQYRISSKIIFHFKNLFLFLIFSVYLWWKVFFISSVDRIVAPVIPIKLLINLCSLEITSLAENNNSPSVQGLFKFRALAIFPPVFVPFTALPLQGRVGSIVTVFTHLTRRGSLS